jgi:hypothetical protein
MDFDADNALRGSGLSSDYPLTEAQIREYREKGHLLLRGVCTPEEIAQHREVFRNVIRKHFPNPPEFQDRDIFGRAFLALTNSFLEYPETRPFVFARRFGKLAAQLAGVDAVRIYHNQVFFKEPGGGPTPWHQDHYYWPLDTDRMITIWIPLVDITPEMGSLRFATGSHRYQHADDLGISEEAMEYFDRFIEARGLPVETSSMKAGDATFHAGWMLHSALGNSSGTTREAAAISYYPEGTYVWKDLTPIRLNDLRICMPGVEPGALAAGEKNPLVYRSE